MVEPVYVDGSYGEGGGQILRVSLALSALTGKPVKVRRIRAGRKNPGIRPQHLAAVKALTQLCDAHVAGDTLGSSELSFSPSELKGGQISIDCGTAGSVTLILQAIIGPAALSPRQTDVTLIGGTDVRWSPTCSYIKHVLLPMYRRIGIDATMEVARRGYYPRGGGIVKLKVEPTEGLTSLALAADSRGDVKICSVASKLPLSVAQRQAESCRRRLLNSGVKVEDVQSEVEDGVTPGTSLLVYHDSHGTVFGSDGIGEKGKPAELVGDEVAEKFIREYRSFASVDSHLADMLPHLLCLASRPSSYSVPEITEHLRSCLYVSQLVTGRSCEVTSGETLPVVRVSGVD